MPENLHPEVSALVRAWTAELFPEVGGKRKMAAFCRVDPGTLSQWLHGRRAPPAMLETLVELERFRRRHEGP